MKTIQKDIETRKFKRAYLIYGEEKYLKRHYEKLLLDALVSDPDTFSGKDASPEVIMNASESLPFFAEFRVLSIKDSGLFAPGRKNDSESLTDYLKDIPETTVIVFNETDVDKRLKLYKTVAEVGYAAEMKRPSDNELAGWVKNAVSKNGGAISPAAAAFLIRYNGGGMDALMAEIMKLTAFKGKSEITKEDIETVCVKSLEAKIFDMVDAIGNKKPEIALDIFTGLLQMKEQPFMILTMIARQFRLIFECLHLANIGMSSSQIADKIGQKSFIVRNCLDQSRNFDEETLIMALNDCIESDIASKTGQMDGKLAVELLIIKYGKAK